MTHHRVWLKRGGAQDSAETRNFIIVTERTIDGVEQDIKARAATLTIAELMGEEAPGRFKQKPGPRSALEAQFERVKQLPKSQQQKIMEVVEALLAQNEAT